jgi:hypothetical protein
LSAGAAPTLTNTSTILGRLALLSPKMLRRGGWGGTKGC